MIIYGLRIRFFHFSFCIEGVNSILTHSADIHFRKQMSREREREWNDQNISVCVDIKFNAVIPLMINANRIWLKIFSRRLYICMRLWSIVLISVQYDPVNIFICLSVYCVQGCKLMVITIPEYLLRSHVYTEVIYSSQSQQPATDSLNTI